MSKLDPKTFYKVPKGQWATHKLPIQMTPAERCYADMQQDELEKLGYQRVVQQEEAARRQQHYNRGQFYTYVWTTPNSGNSTNGY